MPRINSIIFYYAQRGKEYKKPVSLDSFNDKKMAGPFHQGADDWKNFTGGQMAGGFSSGCIWLEAFQLGADSLEHLSRGQMAKEVSRGGR